MLRTIGYSHGWEVLLFQNSVDEIGWKTYIITCKKCKKIKLITVLDNK